MSADFSHKELPLLSAIMRDDVKEARRLIGTEVDIHNITHTFSSPAFLAVKHNAVKCLKLFLEFNANEHNCSPAALGVALEKGYEECALLLINYGVDVTEKYSEKEYTALHLAAQQNLLMVAEKLIDKGLDVNQPTRANKGFSSPLHEAARENHNKIIELLIRKGAEVDKTNDRGATPLYTASLHNNSAEAIQVLHKHGANINHVSLDNITPLIYAATSGATNTARTLVSLGADLNYISNRGHSAISVAAINKSPELLEALLEYHPNLNPDRGRKIGVGESPEKQPLSEAITSKHPLNAYILALHGSKIITGRDCSINLAQVASKMDDDTSEEKQEQWELLIAQLKSIISQGKTHLTKKDSPATAVIGTTANLLSPLTMHIG